MFMCLCVDLCMCVHCFQEQERVLDPMELELEAVVS